MMWWSCCSFVTSPQEMFCDKENWNVLLIQVIQVSDVLRIQVSDVMWCDVLLIQVIYASSSQWCDVLLIQVSDVMSCSFKNFILFIYFYYYFICSLWNRVKVQGIVYLGERNQGKERARPSLPLPSSPTSVGWPAGPSRLPFASKTVPRIWPSRGADKSSSQRQSLSGSQWGSCSTAYNTPAGT